MLWLRRRERQELLPPRSSQARAKVCRNLYGVTAFSGLANAGEHLLDA